MDSALSSLLYNLGFFVLILKGVVRFIHRGQTAYKVLIMQILFTFVEALGISSLLALGIGAAVNIIGLPFLTTLSQERLIYSLLITIITRELGPLLTAFIIIARSGTAIATEMAGMVISHEVEAYISVGLDPIEYLAVPRFLGVTISLCMLNIYFSIFGLAGSFAVAQIFNPLPASVYFGNLLSALSLPDLLVSIIKSIFFGMIIAVLAMLRGLSVERSSTEVPVAGLRAVSSSFGWCITVDILISAFYYIVV
ncbi:MAG: ABC transporter permease [Treponema sp.]|jgi:phospholipid/cholesterol/gamma-HCH transport system permease protein|nr:ABC transporter permease [Treponema sp.]